MSEPQLELSNDALLSTTRAVRKRLDFDRDVPMSAIRECMELAVQAPSGSNALVGAVGVTLSTGGTVDESVETF